MVITESEVDVIDQEWMALILEAKELGLSIEEVRDFFSKQEGKS
ncbi:anti-repressor SinI family protein [Neobacillus sp.]|jgi:DNA-binding transcriptional MerR regulator|nr:anti-repressor SinI family protein [Neobacillus sp.]